jgi:hypothetical protein
LRDGYPTNWSVLPQRLKDFQFQPIRSVVSWALILIAAWLTAFAVVGLFVWALARSAAIGDRDQLEQLDFARALEADKSALDRRLDREDRRAITRPWTESMSGRRAEDALRQDVADAEHALEDAEIRLAEIEARQSG